MKTTLGLVLAACFWSCSGSPAGTSAGSSTQSGTAAGTGSSTSGAATTGSGSSSSGASNGGSATGSSGASTTVSATIRDFRFYDGGDSSTDPDFENPPFGIGQNGSPSSGYQGPWDDPDIVANTLGSDGKPVYKNPGATTLTTHGKAAFDKWYNDVPGTNYHVAYTLPLTLNPDGSYEYDSEQSGVLYDPADASQGKGFFPIDDGSAYQTPFGNQGRPHNFSFTMEIHSTFTYRGGEYFNFRGDDDVFVFINNQLVINLGGIHGPETKQVNIDTLGLTVGQSYPLDFFSAERHVTGSNILFQTTLALQFR
jgi:fibro-slime domain-containing protein